MKKIRKTFHFDVKTHDDETDDNIGIIEGYVSTFGNVDRDGDVITRNAFDRTLAERRASGKPFLPMLWQHRTDQPIGGFPMEFMKVDQKGLFVRGDVNKATNLGHDAFALLKQGVISDFSIGFFVRERRTEDGVQFFDDVELVESSLVTIPANDQANVTDVKSVVPFQNLPVAETAHRWDASAAAERLKELTGSGEENTAQYRKGFLWADDEAVCKLPIADVVDGNMTVIPRALFAAAASVAGARDIVDDERAVVIKHIRQYYDKMNLESPFEKGFGISEIKSASLTDVRKMLQRGTNFTKAAADMLAGLEAGRRKGAEPDSQADGLNALNQALNEFGKGLSHV